MALTVGLTETTSTFTTTNGHEYTVSVTATPDITITAGTKGLIEINGSVGTAATATKFYAVVSATDEDITYSSAATEIGTLVYDDTVVATTGSLYQLG